MNAGPVPEKASGTRRLWGNAYLLLALGSLCWSGNHIAGKLAAADVPPFFLATVRWVIPALLMWPFGMSPIYGLTAIVVGALFLVEAHRLAGRAFRERLHPG